MTCVNAKSSENKAKDNYENPDDNNQTHSKTSHQNINLQAAAFGFPRPSRRIDTDKPASLLTNFTPYSSTLPTVAPLTKAPELRVIEAFFYSIFKRVVQKVNREFNK